MTSSWVLLIVTILHFGMRGSCLLDIERFPVIPGTIYAAHIAYCAILHFLHDLDILPIRYRRRMGWLAAFLIELVLGMAFMEIMGLWLWCSVEHIIHLTIQFVLRHYAGIPTDLYQRWEWAIMGGLMTSLAALLWLNAYEATEPVETKSEFMMKDLKAKIASRQQMKREERQRQQEQKEQELKANQDQDLEKIKHLAEKKREERQRQQQKEEQEQQLKPNQDKDQDKITHLAEQKTEDDPKVKLLDEQHLEVLTTATDC
ncbi:uncharacterized protein LOC108105015 [Drosophila eugracilis]|uniref:uncharacterized protein LOC108105015 n=1 Tax=Drosophila eugracilis TaxID=29029 RepID=UPI0007E6FB7A|nr:uncharacterized protein LOC108105015 [Drosophila eugracilis]